MLHDVLLLALAFGAGSLGLAGLAHASLSVKTLLTKPAKIEGYLTGVVHSVESDLGFGTTATPAAVVPVVAVVATPTTPAA